MLSQYVFASMELKSKGLVWSLKTILLHRNLLLSIGTMDGKVGVGLKRRKKLSRCLSRSETVF